MLPLGTIAPDINLIDAIDGEMVTLSKYSDAKAILIVFTANHCPYAKHVMPELIKIANEYQEKGLQIIAISSNDIQTHPQDGPQFMYEIAINDSNPFPYLYDEDQSVARAFTAACTPDLFLFDADRKLVYRGQLDDSRPGNEIPLTGKYLREALDQLLSGKKITVEQKPSMGCNIKWKNGNEPGYF